MKGVFKETKKAKPTHSFTLCMKGVFKETKKGERQTYSLFHSLYEGSY